MSDLTEDVSRLDAILLEIGEDRYWHAVEKQRRRKLSNYAREKRKTNFSLSECKKLWKKAKGICSWCTNLMPSPEFNRTATAVDHIDPNRQDFNAWENLQLLHRKCNEEKNSKSIAEQAKATGKNFMQILKPENK